MSIADTSATRHNIISTAIVVADDEIERCCWCCESEIQSVGVRSN